MEQKEACKNVLKEFENVVSDIPGTTAMIKCKLRLFTLEPLCTPQYPIPFSMKKLIEKEVQDMLKLDVVERACPPYNSPLVLVKKPDQTFRLMC